MMQNINFFYILILLFLRNNRSFPCRKFRCCFRNFYISLTCLNIFLFELSNIDTQLTTDAFILNLKVFQDFKIIKKKFFKTKEKTVTNKQETSNVDIHAIAFYTIAQAIITPTDFTMLLYFRPSDCVFFFRLVYKHIQCLYSKMKNFKP